MKKRSETHGFLADKEIIELYWKRDEEAINATDMKYKGFIIAIAFNIVHDMDDSEECVNDTYTKIWNSIPPTRPTHFQAFLATIARRTAIDCFRAKKQLKRINSEYALSLSEIGDIASCENDVWTQTDAKELGRIISSFVRDLPNRRMYIFMSRYYLSRPVKEIASMLRCSESTVNKEIASIKKTLKALLEKEGYRI